MQGLAPVNFKNKPYKDGIACTADTVDQFAKLKRSQSRQPSKAQTSSRYRSQTVKKKGEKTHKACIVATHVAATCAPKPHHLLIQHVVDFLFSKTWLNHDLNLFQQGLQQNGVTLPASTQARQVHIVRLHVKDKRQCQISLGKNTINLCTCIG